MQFYLLLPMLLLILPKRWSSVTLLLLIVVGSAYAEWQLSETDAKRHVYFALMARVPEFLIGAWLAVGVVGGNWGRGVAETAGACGGLLLFVCFFLIDAENFPGIVAILPCAATALIIAGCKSRVSSCLSNPALVWIGAISYSLYLWHWPVLAFIRYCTGRYDLDSVSMLLLFASLTLSLACVSYYWVETPLRKPGSFRRLGVLFVVVLLVAFAITPSLNKKIQRPLPQELTRYAPADEICHGKLVGECRRGDPEQPVSALVLGDSHAAQLNYFFEAAGRQQKFAVQVISASNCVPIPGFDVERIPDYSRADCLAQIQALVPMLARTDRVIIAGMWQWQAQSDAFLQALAEFVKTLSAEGKRVIVLAQVPMFEVNVQRMQRFSALGMEIAPERNTAWESGNSKVAKRLTGIDNVFFVDLSHTPFFQHAPYEGGILLYQDNHHLNERGARRYGEMAAPVLAKLLFPLH
jgi:lysophospholipase L1-like esterase